MFEEKPTFSSSPTHSTLIQQAVALSERSPFFLSVGFGLIALSVLCNSLLAGRSIRLWWDIGETACALLLLVTGLVLVTHAFWPQLTRAVLLALAIVLVTSYGLIYVFTLGLLFVSSRGDYGHCEQTIQSVTATTPIPPSAFNPAQKAVFCLEGNYGLFRTRYQILEVYGVADRTTQDAILVQLNRVRDIENTEAIQVLFYEKENVKFWKNDKNGASGGRREPESLLRIALVP